MDKIRNENIRGTAQVGRFAEKKGGNTNRGTPRKAGHGEVIKGGFWIR